MNAIAGLVIIVVGIVLLMLGINEADSFASELSEFFTGNPTDRSIWLMILGVAGIIGGAAMAATGGKRLVKK